MIVIICTKYKKNPSRTVYATEQTRFSKSRPNDLEDIAQGQGSSHATHPLMLLIICTKYGKNPSRTVDATGRTQKVNGQTDGRTDRRTCRKTVTVGRVDQRTHVQVKRAHFRLRMDRRTDRQPENIMPPAPKGGGIKIDMSRYK